MVNCFKIQVNGSDILLPKSSVIFKGDFGIVRAVTYNYVTDEKGTEEWEIPVMGIVNKKYECVTGFVAAFEVPKIHLFKSGIAVCQKYVDDTSEVNVINCNTGESISLGVQDYEVIDEDLIKIKACLEAYDIVGLYRPFQEEKVLFYNYIGDFNYRAEIGEEVAEAISLIYDEKGNIIDEISCYINKKGKEITPYKSRSLAQEFPNISFPELKIIIKSTLRGDIMDKMIVGINELIQYVKSVQYLSYDDFQRIIDSLDDNSFRRTLLEKVRDVIDKEKLLIKLSEFKEVYGIDRIVLVEDKGIKIEDTFVNSSGYRKVGFANVNDEIIGYERPNFGTNGLVEVRSLSIDPYIVEEGNFKTGDITRSLYMADFNLNIWNLPTKEERILKDISLEKVQLFRSIVESLYFDNGTVEVIVDNPNALYDDFMATYFSDGVMLDERGNSLEAKKSYSKVLVRDANYLVVSSGECKRLIVKENYLEQIYSLNDGSLNQMLDSIRNNGLRRN